MCALRCNPLGAALLTVHFSALSALPPPARHSHAPRTRSSPCAWNPCSAACPAAAVYAAAAMPSPRAAAAPAAAAAATAAAQDLVFAAIGEMFEEPSVVGVGMAVRSKEDLLSVWNSDNTSDAVRFAIGERLKVGGGEPGTPPKFNLLSHLSWGRSHVHCS
jgi:Eukaryotic initiation factor 4E